MNVRRSRRRSLGTLVRLAVAEARAHSARTIAAVLAVGLGAGTLTVTLVLAASLRTGMEQGLGVEYAGTDIVLSTSTGTGDDQAGQDAGTTSIPKAALRKMSAIDGVAKIATYTQATAAAQVGKVTRGITLQSLASEPSFVWQGWASGRPPSNDSEIALTAATLDQFRIGLGDRVALGDPKVGRALYRVVGVVDTRGSLRYDSSAYGIVTSPTAQRFAGTDNANVALLRTTPGANVKEITSAINQQAPGGWPQRTSELMRGGAGAVDAEAGVLGMLGISLAAVSLLVAAVTLATTTAAATNSRWRTIALARCVGADKGHLVQLVLLEVLVPSVAGALCGIGLGVLLARLALPLLDALPGVPRLDGDAFTLTARDLLVPLIAAAVLALLAAIVPAWLASRVPPSAALSARGRADTPRIPAIVLAPIALAIAVGGAVAAYVGPSHGGYWYLAAGMALLLIGAGVVLSPVLALTARGLARTPRRPAVRLALEDIGRRPGAAATEAVAIVLAVGVMAMSWVCLGCVGATTSARLSASPLPDLTVGVPSGAPAVSAQVQRTIEHVDGVGRVVPIRFGDNVSVEGKGDRGHVSLAVGIVAVDPGAYSRVLPDRFEPATLRPDTVYLPTSSFPPYPAGTKVNLKGPHGTVHDLDVVYVKDLSVPTAVAPALMQKVTDKLTVRELWIGAARGADRAKVVDEVTGAAIQGGELPVSGPLVADVRLGKAIAMAQAASAGILAVAVIVAVIGAAATGALTVRERTGEYAILRALGLERRGLGSLLLTRVLVVGAIAALVGAAAGAVMGMLVGRAIAVGLDLPALVSIPWLPILLIATLTVLLVRAASLAPLERASYTPPSRVLAQE